MLKPQHLIYILLVLSVAYIGLKYTAKPISEGFTQDAQFMVKRGVHIYDPFYVNMYDQLGLPNKRVPFEIDVINSTLPSDLSTFLDIGCGTGYLVNQIHTHGHQVIGIDQSPDMIKYAETRYPEIEIMLGDARDPMSFDRATFSHILCTNFTIYQFSDKVAFFRNCYYWLIPNNYLILHLVDKHKFDTIVPDGNPEYLSPQKFADQRITKTTIDYNGFLYNAAYDFGEDNLVTFTEKFTDKQSAKVRQNEMDLYMEDVNQILKVAKFCGFIVHGKFDYKEDPHQYLYVLERQN